MLTPQAPFTFQVLSNDFIPTHSFPNFGYHIIELYYVQDLWCCLYLRNTSRYQPVSNKLSKKHYVKQFKGQHTQTDKFVLLCGIYRMNSKYTMETVTQLIYSCTGILAIIFPNLRFNIILYLGLIWLKWNKLLWWYNEPKTQSLRLEQTNTRITSNIFL